MPIAAQVAAVHLAYICGASKELLFKHRQERWQRSRSCPSSRPGPVQPATQAEPQEWRVALLLP